MINSQVQEQLPFYLSSMISCMLGVCLYAAGSIAYFILDYLTANPERFYLEYSY